jgi:cell division protein FtsB
MDSKFFRKIKKQLTPRSIGEKLWANKKWTAWGVVLFVGILFVVFANNGLMQRRKLERERAVLMEKIRIAEDEQKRLQEQSRALDGDKKAVEKVAREKYGMIREGEKVYKIVPPKQ